MNHMTNAFRKAMVLAGGVLCGVPLFAEGENAIDITPATTLLSSMKDAIEDYWDAAEPFIIAVVGLVVVASLIWAGVRLFKGGASKVSGR